MRNAESIVKRYLRLLAAVLLATASCTHLEPEFVEKLPEPCGPITVGFHANREQGIGIATKTVAGADGLSTHWAVSDKVALWALDADGGYALEAQPFNHYGSGFFTADIPAPMEEGSYTYYASYPVPASANGKTVSFVVPSSQDGVSGEGADIMVAGPVSSEELHPIDWLDGGYDGLEMQLKHVLHRVRFYTEAAEALGGDPIQRIVATFPKAVAGTISFNLDDPDGTITSSGTTNILDINLATPVAASDADTRNYITASVIPASFSDGESVKVRFFTDKKVAETTIPLLSRTFAAGHSTPVKLVPQRVSSYCCIRIRVDANNLGEGVQTITLKAPSGCRWSDSGSETMVLSADGEIDAGSEFLLEYEDEDAFRSLSGKTITVTYDSEHVAIDQTLTIPDLTGKYSTDLSLAVPYLLFEDFANVPTFSSDDDYATFVTGDKDPYTFLDGWSAARAGAEAGKCIRLACRRETSARYDARADSAPLNGRLKKSANLSVEFDYGASNQYSTGLISNPDVGQTFYVGYITTTKNYASDKKDGTFPTSQYVHEYSGSYDSTPKHYSTVLPDVAVTDVIRISWRTMSEYNAGLSNTTNWLYIDNVKVKISK